MINIFKKLDVIILNIKSDHKMTIRSMSIHKWVGRHTFISFKSSHDSLIFSNAFFFSLDLGHHDSVGHMKLSQVKMHHTICSRD